MSINISLTAEKFDELIRCLSILKDICNDIDIKGGIIRQRTTDRVAVFEINLQKILDSDSVNIPIIGLKQKLDLFRSFSGRDVELDVDETNKRITISDSDSSLEIKFSHLDFMDNKFMTKEETEEIFFINDENKILDCKVSKIISERMKSVSQIFNTITAQVKFDGDVASISSRSAAKDNSIKFMSGIMLDDPIENTFSSLVILPFTIDHDKEIEFRMYKDQKGTCSNEFRTSIADDIDINIYSKSKLIKGK